MAVLEAVLELKKKGYDDSAIADLLKERGVSPKEIMDAISQANVKSAVDSEKSGLELGKDEDNAASQNMQPSIMEQEAPAPSVPSPQAQSSQEQYIYPTPSAYTEQYPQYSQAQTYQQTGYETETISELAEQIVMEKLSDTNKSLSSLKEFRKITESKIEDVEQRLRKIESMIDNLQLSILNKIGGYGKNLDDIKTEMRAMQDTFSKTLNPLLDRANIAGEFSKEPEQNETPVSEKPARKPKQRDEFEAYLR